MQTLKTAMPLALLLLPIIAHGQATYETGAAVRIPSSAVVIKTAKAKGCTEIFPAGAVVKSVMTKTKGDTTYTVTGEEKLVKEKAFPVDKTIKLEMTGMEGKASLSADEKDKSVLLINYWLNPEVTIPAGKHIRIIERVLRCDKTYSETSRSLALKRDTAYRFEKFYNYMDATACAEAKKKLKEAKEASAKAGEASAQARKALQGTASAVDKATEATHKTKEADEHATQACESITKQSWFIHSTKVIEVFKDSLVGGTLAAVPSKIIDYYLVRTVDEDATYSLKLDNREFMALYKTSWEFGPLTIPFKKRYGYEKPGENGAAAVKVKDDFSADLNVGVFGGYRFGKRRVRYEAPVMKELANLGVTVGPFVNLSTATLDAGTTTAGEKPYGKDEKATIGVLSPGIGAMLDIYNFRIGAFWGKDVGFGGEAKNWNFNNKWWVGFGVGYSITSGFWKK